MKPQLTLQTPLELPYQDISNYLNKLWISEDKDNSGANTFTLMVWQPAWLEQCLVQKGLVNGPITGNLSPDIIEVAKKFILDHELPITTSLNSAELLNLLKENLSIKDFEDFRGQFFESTISTLNPRRLITLAPTLNKNSDIKTFVSAYCPLSDTPAMQPICGDLVVIRGDSESITHKGLKIIDELSIDELPSFGKRAVWCHQNCWESISLHAPACLLCLITLTDSNIAIISALIHPIFRFLYIGAYVFNIPTARGLMWASGIFTTLLLYKEGLIQLI